MRDQPWSGVLLTTAALSLLIGFSIWWGFFDTLDQAPVAEVRRRHRTGPYKIWIFAQLPLAAGVAAAGIAVGNLAHDADAPVLDDSLRIEVELPWLLEKAAKWLLPALRKQATLLLEKK